MQTQREVTQEIEFEAVTPKQHRSAWLGRALLAVVAIGLVVLFWTWCSDVEGRAVRGLPVTERQALYARTLQNLSSVCVTDDGPLRDFCEQQAQLAKAFPECDADCYRLAARQLSRVQPPR